MFSDKIPFARKTSYEAPEGWTIVKMSSGETKWRCPVVMESLEDNKPRRCVQAYRKNAIPKSHVHFVPLARDVDPGFPSDYDEKKEKIKINEFKNQVKDLITIVAVKLDISSKKATSKEMFEFVSNLLKLGKRLENKIPNFDPKPQYFRFCPQTLTNNLIKIAFEEEKDKIHYFLQNIRYVNVAIDTGTTNGFSVLHFVLSNPYYPDNVFPFKSIENNNFQGGDYHVIVSSVVHSLFHKGFELISLICDSQAAQAKGVTDFLKIGNEEPLSISYIPCFNHLINLVFQEIIGLKSLKPYVELIDYLIDFCRSDVIKKQLNKACPTLIKTRWVYICDVLNFFVENRQKINLLLKASDKDEIPEIIIDMADILRPLQKFSLICENRSAKLCEMLPMIDAVIKTIAKIHSQLKGKYSKDLCDFAFKTFFARMLSFPQELLKAAFAVSLPGRTLIRKAEEGFSTKGSISDGSINQSQTENDSNAFIIQSEVFVKNSKEESSTDESKIKLTEASSESKKLAQKDVNDLISQIADAFTQIDISSDISDDPVDKEQVEKAVSAIELHLESQDILESTKQRFKAFTELRDKMLPIDIHLLSEYNLYTNIMASALAQITQKAQELNIDDIDSIKSQFEDWIFNARNDPISTIKSTDNNDTYWRRLHQILPDLSNICLRLCSLGVSEAEVERLLSIQRNLFSNNTTNMSIEVLHARLVMMK